MLSSSSTIPSITTNCEDSSLVDIPYLPDELLLNCLVRVSRFYYPTLFLVSKRFRSLLASNSKELYKTRKLLGCTESCLYVCLSFAPEYSPSWFILCRTPIQIPNPNPNPNPNPKHTLVSIPTQGYFPTRWWDLVADGFNIYMIGGYDGYERSSKVVFVMDCRSHIWCEAPSMQVARKNTSACVLDGKIYVAGGIEDYNSLNCIECFDPKTQKWEYVACPSVETLPRDIYKSLAIKGKLYLIGKDSIMHVYKPNENRWEAVRWVTNIQSFDMAKSPDCFCSIDNVLFSCGFLFPKLQWYDSQLRSWRHLAGVEELPKSPYVRNVRLVNYGGNLAVLWEVDIPSFGSAISPNNEIWCAVISLEKRNNQEIYGFFSLEKRNNQEVYGKVEWCEVVLTVPEKCYIDKCITVSA